MSDSVFYKSVKPGDSFFYSIGKTSTTIPWTRPSYENVHKTLTEIKNCTTIFDRYEIDLQGKCLTTWKTKDLDMMIFPKVYTNNTINFQDIDVDCLEDDISTIHEIGFSNRLLIDLNFCSKRNFEAREMNYDYIINHPIYKKYKSEDNQASLKMFFNHAFIEDKDIFFIRASPIIKRINDEISSMSSYGIEITPFLRLRSFENDTIRVAGGKIFNRILKNPTKNIVVRFDANEFLNITEEEFKRLTNHDKNLII